MPPFPNKRREPAGRQTLTGKARSPPHRQLRATDLRADQSRIVSETPAEAAPVARAVLRAQYASRASQTGVRGLALEVPLPEKHRGPRSSNADPKNTQFAAAPPLRATDLRADQSRIISETPAEAAPVAATVLCVQYASRASANRGAGARPRSSPPRKTPGGHGLQTLTRKSTQFAAAPPLRATDLRADQSRIVSETPAEAAPVAATVLCVQYALQSFGKPGCGGLPPKETFSPRPSGAAQSPGALRRKRSVSGGSGFAEDPVAEVHDDGPHVGPHVEREHDAAHQRDRTAHDQQIDRQMDDWIGVQASAEIYP